MSNLQISAESTDRIEDLHYEPVSPRYRSVQIANSAIAYALLASMALLLLLLESPVWCVVTELAITAIFISNLVILRNAYRFKGYALREHDITYRNGVIFPKVTTVPFSRIQQVSISQTPVSKFFNLCALDIVNGAQDLSSLVIQGLSKEKAENIKRVINQRLDRNHD